MRKEFIAYQGDAFTIEWYYNPNGNSQALEYFDFLNDSEKRKALMLFKRMGDSGKILDTTKFNNEGDSIYAFKPQPSRFLCFFQVGKKIIITNGFLKKQQKLPKKEKERALRTKEEYLKAIENGRYYD